MAAKAKQAKQAESEPEEEEQIEEGAPKKKGKLKLKLSRKLIIIVAAALVILAGAGGGAYFFLVGSKHAAPKQAAAKPAFFVNLPDVLVNLSNPGSDRTQYLKVKIVLEVANKSLVDVIKPLMPRVVDAFQSYLRELRPTDLDGSAGLYRMREALTRRVNAAIAPSHVTAVLFKEIIVQ